jgi:hypothetical protein
MKKIVPVPDGFSVDIPDFNLVFNVSPFPVIKPVVLTETPYEVEDHLVWVHMNNKLYGLFDRKVLNKHRCPTCGGEFNKPDV